MSGFLKSLDMFKVAPDATLQGNRGLHSSRIGQYLTILLILSGISLLVYFSLDMLGKTNPRVQTTSTVSSVDMILNNVTFPFAFAVVDTNNKFYVDERVYSVKGFYTVTNRKVNLVRCDPNTPRFKVSGPETAGLLWCLADKQDELDVIGINRSENIAIDIVSCQNTSTYNSCLPQEEIVKRLYGNRLRIFYNEFIFEPDDFEDPLKETVRFFFPSFTTKMIKQTNFNIGQTNYITDRGWLYKSTIQESKITVETVTQFFEDKEVLGNVFKRVYLRAVTENKTITRTYDKFQDVVPRWNAIFTLLLIVSKIICDSYYKFKAQEKLVRDIIFLQDKSAQRLIKLKSLKSLAQAQKGRPEGSKNLLIESNSLTKREKDKMGPVSLQISKKDINSISYSEEDMKDQPKEEDDRNLEYFALKNFKIDNITGLNLKQNRKNKKRNSFQTDSRKSTLLCKKANSVDNRVEDIKLDIDDRAEDIKLAIEEDLQIRSKNKDDETATATVKMEKPNKNIETKSSKDFKKKSGQEDNEIGFFTWLLSSIRKTERYKLFLKRSEVIQKEFNFQNHAKRFMGIDLLKYLILTKEQQIVFDTGVKAYVNLKLHSALEENNQHSDLWPEDLRILLNNEGFDNKMQGKALKKLRAKKKPDEKTHKILDLLNIMFPPEAELEEEF